MKSFKRAMQVGPKNKEERQEQKSAWHARQRWQGAVESPHIGGWDGPTVEVPGLNKKLKKIKLRVFGKAFVLISSKPPSAKNPLPVSGFRFLGTVGALRDH